MGREEWELLTPSFVVGRKAYALHGRGDPSFAEHEKSMWSRVETHTSLKDEGCPPPIKDFLLLLGNEGEARGKWKSPGLGVLCISLESLPWASHLLSLGLTASLPGLCG